MFCREQAAQLRERHEEIEEAGATLAFVGNGSQFFARAFREDLNLDAPVLIDPELRAFKAAGLKRGVIELLSPKLPINAVRAFASGARQSSIQGDAFQLGGAFVIAPGGESLFEQRSRVAGDHADVGDILAALQRRHDGAVPRPGALARIAKAAAGAADLVLDPTILFSFDATGFRRHALSFDENDLRVDLSGRHVVITGANSGLGYEAARSLAGLGARLTLVCRSEERGRAAVESIKRDAGSQDVDLVVGDLSEPASVRAVAARLASDVIDVLIHNAGLLPDARIENSEGLELTFATHVVGPHLLTRLLLPALRRAPRARVIWVSSGGMYTRRLNLDDPQWLERDYDGVLAYAETKRAQVILAELWSEQLRSDGVVVNSMHPGWAATPGVKTSIPTFYNVTRALLRTPAQGADTIVWLSAAEVGARDSGRFYFDRKPRYTHFLPGTRETLSERQELWALCEKLTQGGGAA